MPEKKEEVVISGIGGYFPESNNLNELKHLLFNKINGITIDSRRWNPNEQGVVSGTGKLKDINRFDTTFFSVHPKLATAMDTMTKLSLERSVEAIFDAGLCLADLYETNTAVFMSSAINETEMLVMDGSKNYGFTMLGNSRTMQANRISYVLNLTGPSFSMDGGWICGSNNLEKAKEMIENGVISSAIIGVTNMVLRPEIQLQFQGLQRLNNSVHTKPFSADADGYNRSEACIVFMLQKASEAKRSYGTLLSVKSIQFGDHQGHVTEHEGDHFKSLLLDSYREANIDPATVEYIEAYGSGIKHEDCMELNVMESVFCTEQRKTPLKVGSVKSNLGHCEASGLFMSIVKAIIALDSGYIPPNINYTEPNEHVPALKNGKIQVITEKTPLISDVVGVSSFGLLNAFSHIIMQRNNKIKNTLINNRSDNDLPCLLLVSGRNEENVRETVKQIKNYKDDEEFIALTRNVFNKNINTHFYRSYLILFNKEDSNMEDVWNVDLKKRPVWFIFAGMGSQWHGMGSQLMQLPIFANAINKCDSLLKPRGIDIKHILTSQDPTIFDNILNSFVGIAAVQIGLVDILKALDIMPDGIIGHSVGELGCAYADGCFTAEEMILSAYARGRASIETEFIPGMMAAIGLGYAQIKDRIPHDIDVACHNSASSCTISGPVDSINAFVSELKSEGVFAKAVNVAGIAYHSRYIQSAGPTLLKYLKQVIKEPKMRSTKWISSSLPEAKWNSDLAKYSSPEYHTNNLLNSVLFEDSLKHIPSDAITIEIAPCGLLQSILKGALPETVTNIPLTTKVFGSSLSFFLTAIGKMYISGLNPKIQVLYPTITFPVSRETPSIHSLPFWDHTQEWLFSTSIRALMNLNSSEGSTLLLLNDIIHLFEYEIYGHHIIPLSFILFNVWKKFTDINEKTLYDGSIQFNNLQFKNDFKIHPLNASDHYIMIQSGSGLFEYNIDNEVILSGHITYFIDNNLSTETEKPNFDKTSDDFQGCVLKDEIYAIFKNKGLSLGDNYKNITNFGGFKNNIQGYVEWKNDWIFFLNGLLNFPLLENLATHKLEIPVSIKQISINPVTFENDTEKDVCVNYNLITKEIFCSGIKISGIRNGPMKLTKPMSAVVKLEKQTFTLFNNPKRKNINDFIYDSMDIITEADKFNLISGKLILCTPYHYDDSISNTSSKLVKQYIENQQSINVVTMNWDNVINTAEEDESGTFITIINVNYILSTIKALAKKKCSYIIVSSQQKLQDVRNWKIVIQQKLNDGSYLSLLKNEIEFDDKCVKMIYSNDNLNMCSTLEKYKSSKEMVYIIISKSEPLEGIHTYVKEILMKLKTQKVRFLFILDSNAPEFEPNNLFYTNQLTKGLIVNVYKNGDWGYYKRIVVQDTKHNGRVPENPALKYFLTNGNNRLAIKYLGINMKELVIDDRTENEFGPLEYSGVSKENKTVMGIAQMSTKTHCDPILLWPVPSTWSLEDACTVPLTYAIGYYVFNILYSLQRETSILVTSGLHPLGQAAISIGLAEKCNTYVIVESNQQAHQLLNIFPELARSRVLVNTDNKFDIKLKMMTKSKGIDLILNFLSGEAFQAAFRTVADHGKFFQFSKYDMKNYRNIGTRIFLKNTSFSVVSSNMLLNESDHNKQIVQQLFLNGLNRGVIKPLCRSVSTMPFSYSKMFDIMRNAYKSTTPEKVLLCLNDSFKSSKIQEYIVCETYQCRPDFVYVIVGNKSDWLEIAEWLVDRGAQKIVISVKRCLMLSNMCRRFDRLISRCISVQVESDIYLNTKEGSLKWLNRLTSSKILGSLFVINQFNVTEISNMRYAFEEYLNKTVTTSFVCISSKGEYICADLKSIGLNALNISWDDMFSQQNNTAKILPSLDLLLQKSNTLETSSFICSEKGTIKTESSKQINEFIANYFPESFEELNLLNDKLLKEARFVEVSTRSPRFSQLKSVTAVFVIPGFKPKLIESLYKKMFYPAFEAQIPEGFSSIDELSHILVNKLKSITDRGYVSLIGDSWGGIVALKMAQILEAQGTLVTVSLLEGDPEILTDWAKSFFSNDYFTSKLNTMYNKFINEFSEYALEKHVEELKLLKMISYQKTLKANTQRVLNWIRFCLKALLESKPLSNKLHTKVLIFRYQRISEFSRIDLRNYCINPPFVHVIAEADYKHMIVEKKMIEIITKNVPYSFPVGVESSLNDKYHTFYFYNEKILKFKD